MADGEEKSCDFYQVLELKKECTNAELRNAYKKLAMKWHPDRCAASGNTVEEGNKKFQAIQQAYSVLSDANKRFLYDVGIYDCNDDDDEDGMGDFLNEMVSMINEDKSNESGNKSFQELQDLFEDIFCSDNDVFDSSQSSTFPTHSLSQETYSFSNKRNSCDMSSGNFCMGAKQYQENAVLGGVAGEGIQTGAGSSRRDRRKQKISSGQDVSSSISV